MSLMTALGLMELVERLVADHTVLSAPVEGKFIAMQTA
jgi:hypothetical protein